MADMLEEMDTDIRGLRALGFEAAAAAEIAARLELDLRLRPPTDPAEERRLRKRLKRLQKKGRKLTPPVSCGLLPGTFRGHLLERGEIEEEVLPVDSIERASKLFLITSVRRWCDMLVGG